MRGSVPAIAALALAAIQVSAFGQSANYVRDGSSCDLNDGTTLRELCPNGMGLPTYPSTQDMMTRSPNIANMVVDAANQYGVDPRLALAVSAHEGAMSACAGSFSGVQGPMQLTQATGRSYGMDRGVLSQNIKGGMLTLKAAIKSCGGSSNIRCLADRYNGSTESQRRNWTNDVTRRLAGLQTASIPAGCNGSAVCSGPGDFPGQNPNGSQIAGAGAPAPASTDIQVPDGMV